MKEKIKLLVENVDINDPESVNEFFAEIEKLKQGEKLFLVKEMLSRIPNNEGIPKRLLRKAGENDEDMEDNKYFKLLQDKRLKQIGFHYFDVLKSEKNK